MGLGSGISEWEPFAASIGNEHGVLAYERAGIGESKPGKSARTPENIVDELHQLILELEHEEQIIFIGHSQGGLYAHRYFCKRQEEDQMNYLIVVDMQNDFIDGSLGTAEAAAIVPAVVEKIKAFEGEIIFTRDTHQPNYLETQEGHKLPVTHCIEGTKGWELAPAIRELCKNKPINKPTFGSTELGHYMAGRKDVESITLIGLCTDICVISNALLLKACLPEVPIFVDASCCAGVTPQSHLNALEAMKMCQIEIVSE